MFGGPIHGRGVNRSSVHACWRAARLGARTAHVFRCWPTGRGDWYVPGGSFLLHNSTVRLAVPQSPDCPLALKNHEHPPRNRREGRACSLSWGRRAHCFQNVTADSGRYRCSFKRSGAPGSVPWLPTQGTCHRDVLVLPGAHPGVFGGP